MFKRTKPRLFTALAVISYVLSLTVARGQNAVTPIYLIQGAGESTPLAGQQVVIEGIVTGDFQEREKLSGFFVQDEKGDGDPKTSDGIFVYVPQKNVASAIDVKIGDRVRVAGRPEEFKGCTQLDDITSVEVLQVQSSTLPVPSQIPLPLDNAASLETLEGMLVAIPQTLTVTGNYNLVRYGELELASGGRLFAPTNGNGHSREENARRLILLDDGSTRREPQPTPHLQGAQTRRIGDTVSGLTGVLTYAFNAYRIHPTVAPAFATVNSRPTQPALPKSGLKIAGFNVHNYFTTFKSVKKSARGAKDAEEFGSQSAKVVTALKVLDADIVGLMEIENNGATAVTDLITKLNAAYGAKTYEAVADPVTGTGSDLIKCAIIYKPATVERLGEASSDTDKIYSRAPVAQTFRARKGGGVLTVVANHFKSKGSCPKTGDVDSGQGCWNEKRTEQSKALLEYIKELQNQSGDEDVLALGDFNAYMEEDPIRALEAGGLKNLNALLPPSQRYSTQYQAHSGFLDYAFATESLRAQVAGATVWHINADEPAPVEKKDTKVEASFYRCSDHDPVIVAMHLKSDSAPAMALR